MTASTAGTIPRFVAIASRLDSPFEGERLAALEAANKVLAANGLTWRDLFATSERRLPLLGTWRQKCVKLLERRGELRPWEVRFVSGLPSFHRLSVKQRHILDEIVARILGEEAQ